MTVRPAEPQDEEIVVALWRACDLVVNYNDPRLDFRNALRSGSSEVLVGEDENRSIVGTVLVGDDGHRGWLYYVAVEPSMQGQGIGRMMVQAAEHWLQRRGVEKVQLLVRDTNTKVVRFYERLGFEPLPRIVMGKWLKPEL